MASIQDEPVETEEGGVADVGPSPLGRAPTPNRMMPLAGAQKYPKGKTLTRDDMAAVIRSGGSVIHRGQVFKSLKELPTHEEMAEGDEQQTANLKAQIDEQIASLSARKARLDAAARLVPKPDPKGDEKPGDPAKPQTSGKKA